MLCVCLCVSAARARSIVLLRELRRLDSTRTAPGGGGETRGGNAYSCPRALAGLSSWLVVGSGADDWFDGVESGWVWMELARC